MDEKFCMSCGGSLNLQEKDGRRRPVCRQCGWVYFKNPASASAVVIMLDGKIVLVKRKVAPHVGSWCLPAGFEEYDESPEATAVREAKEETNLDVRIQGLYSAHFSTAYPSKNTVVHIYLAEPIGGELRAGDDALEVKAFPLNKLPDKIAFRSHLEVIDNLKKQKEKSS